MNPNSEHTPFTFLNAASKVLALEQNLFSYMTKHENCKSCSVEKSFTTQRFALLQRISDDRKYTFILTPSYISWDFPKFQVNPLECDWVQLVKLYEFLRIFSILMWNCVFQVRIHKLLIFLASHVTLKGQKWALVVNFPKKIMLEHTLGWLSTALKMSSVAG